MCEKVDDIKELFGPEIQIGKFFNRFAQDKCRYASWEHCYVFFKKFFYPEDKEKDVDIDKAALNLAFYLASWGMYRGSSFLLQHDYKIHEGLIEEISKDNYSKYKSLLDENVDNYGKKWDIIDKLIKNYGNKIDDNCKDADCANCKKNENCGEIVKIYCKYAKNYAKKLPSDTLVTKILMGIFGCIPAYDRYFKKGVEIYKRFCIKDKNNKIDKLNGDGYQLLWNFYNKEIKNKDIKISLKCSEYEKYDKEKYYYPPMKLVDSYFWQIGYDADMGKVKCDNKDIYLCTLQKDSDGHIEYFLYVYTKTNNIYKLQLDFEYKLPQRKIEIEEGITLKPEELNELNAKIETAKEKLEKNIYDSNNEKS